MSFSVMMSWSELRREDSQGKDSALIGHASLPRRDMTILFYTYCPCSSNGNTGQPENDLLTPLNHNSSKIERCTFMSCSLKIFWLQQRKDRKTNMNTPGHITEDPPHHAECGNMLLFIREQECSLRLSQVGTYWARSSAMPALATSSRPIAYHEASP